MEAVKMALRVWKPDSISNTTELYGPGAVEAVKTFQTARGLSVDGIYGLATHAKLATFFDARASKLYAKPRLMLVQPILLPANKGVVSGSPALAVGGANGGIHETAGLPGYPALDWIAAARAHVVAPEDGIMHRVSGHDPANGPVSGIHGPFGRSLYLNGTASGWDYYITHLDVLLCSVGERVRCGQKIATVADYAHWGGLDHAHVGVHADGPYTQGIRKLAHAANHL